jgi:D-aminopeptidase
MTPNDPCPIKVGEFSRGALDAITDVAGVSVGHCTLDAHAVQTGVTVVRAHQHSHYLNKVPAGATVINGFGKSVGLMQLDELGVLETPIALTNTFSVPAVAQAQIQQAFTSHPEIGRAWPTVNPLVFECNDGYLNDIQAMRVDSTHYLHAFERASACFEQGAVGAGRGMSCFGLKGGIGSASRLVPIDQTLHTVGALVLSNFGKLQNLSWLGQPLGKKLARQMQTPVQPSSEKGSIIMLLATDAPLDARQLRRLSMRAAAGLARTGSFFGHGSGDIALAFSTAYTVPAFERELMPARAVLHEQKLDGLFEAAADAIEQSILSSLWSAQSVIGRDGHQRRALREVHGFSTNGSAVL